MRRPLTHPLRYALGACVTLLAISQVVEVDAADDPVYTVPAGVQVIEITAVGGGGGNSPDYPGGAGCSATVALPVSEGDEITWVLGEAGGNSSYGTTDASGAVGGGGARSGGDGGALTNTFARGAIPGAGGGGATGVSLDDVEIIVAAGGGGAVGSTGGGSGCYYSSVDGGGGAGSEPVAGGGTDPATGGAGGLGNGGSARPNPGYAGNSSLDTPAGKGGNGAIGQYDGFGGGGGGGGVSGGGGGAGEVGQFNSGKGSGGAGLSMVPDTPEGLALPVLKSGPVANDTLRPFDASVAIRAVDIVTASLPSGNVGTAYSASLDASLDDVTPEVIAPTDVDPDAVSWGLAEGEALPPGLSLSEGGTLSGVPTSPGTFEVTFVASVLEPVPAPPGGPDAVRIDTASPRGVRAQSVTTISFTIGAALPPTGSSTTASIVTLGSAFAMLGSLAMLVARRRRVA